MKFTEEINAAFPISNPMPPLLKQALQLLEEHGCVRTRRDGVRYMTLHPEPENSDIATTTFYVPDPALTALWTRSADPEVNHRLTIFLRTGGDVRGPDCGWTTTGSNELSIWVRDQDQTCSVC